MTPFVHGIGAWLEFVSIAFCTGAIACRILVFPPSAQTALPEEKFFSRRTWRLFGIALALIFAASAAELMIRAGAMSNRPVFDVFPVISAVLFKTHYGHVWIARIAALMLLSFFTGIELRHRNSPLFLGSALFLLLFIAATRSASGHAADAGDFSWAEIMDWLHIVSASVWGGGLFVLSLTILPEIIRRDNFPAPLLASVASRFSRLAGAAVGVLALTALYNAWLHVGRIEGLWMTSYGAMLIVKIALFLVLVNLGAFNRYVSVPLLRQLGGLDPGRRGIIGNIAVRIMPGHFSQDVQTAALRFMRSVRTEAIIIVIVLFFAGLLVQQVPARHALRMMSGQGHTHAMGDKR